MGGKIISVDSDRWSLVILVLLALLIGFFVIKAIMGLNIVKGLIAFACIAAMACIPVIPKGVRIGFFITGFIVGSIMAFF